MQGSQITQIIYSFAFSTLKQLWRVVTCIIYYPAIRYSFPRMRNVIFPNQECSKTIYLFSLHYHFKSIAAEWRRLCRTDLQNLCLSYRNNLLEIFCRPMLPSNLWFSDRLLRILGFSMKSVCCFVCHTCILTSPPSYLKTR